MPATATPSTCCCCPKDPGESFHFAADAFDLAERLQTPIFVMMDLDIGMNDWLSKPLTWDDSTHLRPRQGHDRRGAGSGKLFGRYLDVDGDAIPYRTLPGTHPSKGAYFTRGTSPATAYAKYSEEGADYVDNMQRLLRKLETAKTLLPKPILHKAKEDTRYGALYYGSTAPAMDEALLKLEDEGMLCRHHAGARLSLRRRGGGVHPRARAGVRGGAEPRRADDEAIWSTNAPSIRRGSSPSCIMTERRLPRASSRSAVVERMNLDSRKEAAE